MKIRMEADGHAAACVPDCIRMSDAAVDEMRGLDVVILDALRPTPHPTHLSLSESLALLARIGAVRSYVTRLCRRLWHEATERPLPPSVRVSFDGLDLECGAP